MSEASPPKFRRRFHSGPVLSHDERIRQGRVVEAARAALVSTDAVKAFLNTPHETLHGRPLDLAIGSNEGLLAVEATIAADFHALAESAAR